VEKYSGAGQITDDNMALAHWQPTKQRLQKHTHESNTSHCNSGHANGPQNYVCTYIVCLVKQHCGGLNTE